MSGDPRLAHAAGAHDAGIVVPIRSFTLGKARLASHVPPSARAALAREMADRVVDAAGPRSVVVVSSARDVVAWARRRGLHDVADPGTLDGAADAGRARVRDLGLPRVVVAHADLPLVTSLDALVPADAPGAAILVACHRDDGTPVIGLPTDAPFAFSYGPGSFRRHLGEAHRCGLEVRVVVDAALSFDVDVPADLETLAALRARVAPSDASA
jgi:2-phospho-L-lactate guanylyltransferase